MNAMFSTPAAPRSPTRGMGAQGYRLSSDELQAGLDVRAISLTALPVELVSELLRMRKAWGADVFLATAPAALG